MSRPFNVLLIICDTLRPEYCGCYGNSWIRTPHIDNLARESVLFTHSFAASFPTGPMRKDLHTGRFTFAYTGWAGQLSGGEALLARVLRENGYLTSLVGDTPANEHLDLGFDEVLMIKGQAHDLDPYGKRYPLPASLRKLRTPPERLQVIMRNAALRRGEEDCYAAKTMRVAHRWLEENYGKGLPFFLTVDTFDPHEPWDPPRYYIDHYDPEYRGEELFEPAYEPADYATPEEITHMRYMYAGEVSMVDRWVGYLLDAIDNMGLRDNTIVILTSDHGFYHGEHNLIGKVLLDRDGNICGRWPLYRTIAWIPLLIRMPEMDGGMRVNAFCQPPDLMPTILEMLGIDMPQTVQGASLLPLIRGEVEKIRDFVVTSLTHIQDKDVRSPASFRTSNYLYIYGGDEWESELYDLREDPEETRDIIELEGEVAESLHMEYLRFLRSIDCPSLSLEARTEFNPARRSEVPYVKSL